MKQVCLKLAHERCQCGERSNSKWDAVATTDIRLNVNLRSTIRETNGIVSREKTPSGLFCLIFRKFLRCL